MRRGRRAILIASMLMLLAASLALVPASVVASSSGGSSDGNSVSPTGLLPGDIILGNTPKTWSSKLIPGEYSHAMMYCGTVKSGEKIWDRTNSRWMPVGEHYIIHSAPRDDDDKDGLGYDTWQTVVNSYDNVVVLRVLKPGGQRLTATERTNVVNVLKSKLSGGTDGYPVGPKYDSNWLSKKTDPPYYCSEAVWAAYKTQLGIDLDSDTSPFNIGVSPDDLLKSQFTSVIAAEVGSDTWSPVSGVYKLSLIHI